MKKIFYLLFFLFVALFAFTLNLKNPQYVNLEYYFNISWEAPLVLVLTMVFILGLLFGWLLMTLSVFKSKRQVGKSKKALAKVEKEVASLRAETAQTSLPVPE